MLSSDNLSKLPISNAALSALMADLNKTLQKRKESRQIARDFVFHGNNERIQHLIEPLEVLVCGAAGTGKTLAILHRIHNILANNANVRWLIVRKVRADLAQSVLVTFEAMLGEDHPLLQGARRENRLSYKYPNGSEIILAGMDRPGRILSAEFDGAYLSEAVQFDQEDLEIILMRLRHSALNYKLCLMDTNPDRPDHWLKRRCDEGQALLLNTTHKDNPAFFDHAAGEWTEAGEHYIGQVLERLSGVRRARYLENQWVIAEGAIYDEWNEAYHVIEEADLPEFDRRIVCIDFGYTNPFVAQWWGIDHDGRMYLYREIYMTRLLVEDAAGLIKAYDETIDSYVADHDAEDRATLRKHGINTVSAYKAVNEGIQAVKERLRRAGDEKPRLFIVRGARVRMDIDLREAGKPTSTLEEITGYVWNDRKTREEPKKEDDHGMDALRYAVMHVDKRSSPVKSYDKNPFYT